MSLLMLLIPVVVCVLVYFLLRMLMIWDDSEVQPYEHGPLAEDAPLSYDRPQVHLDRDPS